MRDERRLHRMQFVAMRDALDGENLGAVMAHRQRQAGIDPPAVDQHRAGAALAAVAALFGAGQIQPLAQQVEQRDAGIVEFDAPPHAVDGEVDGEVHAVLRSVLWSKLDRGRRGSSGGPVPRCGGRPRNMEAPSVYKGPREIKLI